MIQELLGGGGLVDERKISIPGGLGANGSPVSASPSPSSTSSSATSSPSSSSSEQNLRCPRCDSSNTKFCYYNNYNLTQPRHFCKTCRRYWTKGGALRNVPIGGGCRKTKNTGVSVGTGKSGGGKAKSSELGRSNLGGGGGGFDQELQVNPILWASPQNSHLLALLRATQSSNTNPSTTPNFLNINPPRIKDEGAMIGSHLIPDSALMLGALNARNLGLDPALGQISMSLCNSWKNSQYQHQPQQQHSMMFGEVPTSGIHELYQKLRSPTNYYPDHSQLVLGNMGSAAAVATNSTTTTSMLMEQSPVAGGEFGYWNLPFSWSDMPATNGAFP